MQLVFVGLLFGAFVVFVIRTVWLMHLSRKAQLQHAEELFSDRTLLPPDQFASTFFPNVEANIPVKLRNLLQEEVGFDLARLHPRDRLVGDLGLGVRDGLQPNAFAYDVERELGISFPKRAWAGIQTFSDLVAYCSNQTAVV